MVWQLGQVVSQIGIWFHWQEGETHILGRYATRSAGWHENGYLFHPVPVEQTYDPGTRASGSIANIREPAAGAELQTAGRFSLRVLPKSVFSASAAAWEGGALLHATLTSLGVDESSCFKVQGFTSRFDSFS